MANILTLANEITTLQNQLAEKKQQLRAALDSNGAPLIGGKKPTKAAGVHYFQGQKPSGPPVTDRVRSVFNTGGKYTFSQLWAAITSSKWGGEGSATKFALKSALGKGIERGEFSKDGDGQSMVYFKKPATPPKVEKEKAKPAKARKPQRDAVPAAGYIRVIRGRTQKTPGGSPPAGELRLTDPCDKCGLEMGSHDGKECPKD